MRFSVLLLPILFLGLISAPSHASPVVNVQAGNSYFLVNEVEYLLDASHELGLSDVRASDQWQLNNKYNVNFSIIPDTLWLRFHINAQTDGTWFFKVPYPLLDYLDIHARINQTDLDPIYTGDMRPFSSRPIRHSYFVEKYSLKAGDHLSIYLKVRTSGASEVPIQFMSEKDYKSDNTLRLFLLGWMNGILVIMLVYNLSIYLFIRDPIYVVYAATVGLYLTSTAFYNGTLYQFIFPNNPELITTYYPLSNGLFQFINSIFIILILELYKRNKIIKYYFYSISFICFLTLVFSLALPYHKIIGYQVLAALILNFSAFFVGLVYALKGERIAIFFTIAWGLYILGMLIANLRVMGHLEVNWFVLYGYQVEIFISVSVLSIALAQRIEIQRRESIQNFSRFKTLFENALAGLFVLNKKGDITDTNPAFRRMLGYDSNEEVIAALNKNKRQYIYKSELIAKKIFEMLAKDQSISNFEVELQHKDGSYNWYSLSIKAIQDKHDKSVSHQGSIINIQERKTSEENKQKAMQERMLAMEHLVIGICHEINTPLGVSRSAVQQLRDDFEFLSHSYENKELTKTMFTQRLEFETNSVREINENLSRINQLISNFKEVSVLQKGYKHETGNLQNILDEVELVLTQKIGKDNIQIDCDKEIQFIGYPRAVNDMLTNLYLNRISAMEDPTNSIIKIHAHTEKEQVVITFTDNTSDFNDENIKDIFNPFYTSQQGEQETLGLGLFQVFNIITQLLDGEITVKYQKPGLMFTMSFPLNVSKVEDRGNPSEEPVIKMV